MLRAFLRYSAVSLAALLIVSAFGCGGGGGSNPTPPTRTTTTYTLTVNTSNPDTGVSIAVSPSDDAGAGNGSSSLSRTFNDGMTVTLVAPTTSGSNTFNSWQGCTSVNANTCTVTMTANTTLTAYYTSPMPTNWTLTWSDEFNAMGGVKTAPDTAKWGYDVGVGNPNGWGNNELECYTNSLNNSYQDGTGNLVIEAMPEPGACAGAKQYTSARLLTKGKFSQTYGKIEAKIKLPYGQGIWPAFWALGSNIDTVSWPACGEMDIMESVTTAPLGRTKVQSSLHSTNFDVGQPVDLGGNIDDNFHVYGVIWTPNQIKYYVDDETHPFITYTPANMGKTGVWSFNHPFFVILNVAVGGNWPGSPDGNTFATPQKMVVDYVRVYTGS
jgi:beta-glucanase (GH16 family)